MKVLKGRKLVIVLIALVFAVTAITFAMISGRKTFADDSSVGLSEDNPYLIESAEQLAYMAEVLNSGNAGLGNFVGNDTNFSGVYFKLTNDIDLSAYDNWAPIGSPYNFGGTFDGGGHIIKNLNCQKSFSGLFGCIGLYGVVKNIGIESGSIISTGQGGGGGIAGTNYGTIENCFNKAKAQIGGITGYNYGKIENCFNVGNINGYNLTGGIAGENGGGNQNALIKNCYNISSISGLTNIGGITGRNRANGIITNCYSAAKFPAGYDTVGGIVGVNNGIIEKCYFDTDVAGSGIPDIGTHSIINSGYLSTLQMTDDKVLEENGAMEDLQNDSVWFKRINTGGYLYYPELSVFANSSNPLIVEISKNGGKIAANDKFEGSAIVNIDNWVYGTEPSAIVVESEDYDDWTVLYKLAGEDDETAVSDIPTKAGNYIAVVHFNENDAYAERIIDVEFTIFKAKVSKPDETNDFTYDGDEKSLPIEASDLYTISGNSKVFAGTYDVLISLNDKENYEWEDGSTEDLTLKLNILKANPAYTVPSGLTAVEGQKLSDIALPSNFSWLNGNLSVGAKGERKFAAKFTPTDTENYNIIEVEITLTVNAVEKYKGLADVTINDWVYGSEPSAIVVESEDYDDWIVLYKLAGEDDEAAVYDIPVNAGNYIAIVFFEETDTYAERIIDVSFSIFTAKVSKPDYETNDFTYDGNEKSLSIEASDLYTISGNSKVFAGTYDVLISLNDKENYEWLDGGVEDLLLKLNILKANPAYTVPSGLTAVEGQKLSDIALPSNFSWLNGNLSVGAKGERKFAAKFTPSDTKNYNIIEVEITITVSAGGTENPEPESEGLSGGAIAGIVIGCVLAACLTVILIIVIVKKKNKKQS